MLKTQLYRIHPGRIGLGLALLLNLTLGVTAQENSSSLDGLIRLMAGNERFVSGKAHPKDYLSERPPLADAQHPYAIVLACADSRVPPELLFDESLGCLFVVRTAGHVVDPVALGSIEYAVEHLHVNLLLVLGHENCGAVKATISGGPVPPNIQALVRRIKPAVEKAHTHSSDEKVLLPTAIRENVRYQMQEAMFESDVLSEMVAQKRLALVGGVYDLRSGRVELVVTDVAVSRLEKNLAGLGKSSQTATTQPAAAPQHSAEPPAATAPHHALPSEPVTKPVLPQEKRKETAAPTATRFADSLRVAYAQKANLLVKKTTLMRDEKDSCATENCRSIAAGERVSLENPTILSVMGRPQIKVRYNGRPCYILADPEAIEAMVH